MNSTDLRTSNRRLKLLSELAERLLGADAPVDAARAAFDMIAEELELDVYVNYLVEVDGSLRLDSWTGIPGHVAHLIARLEPGEAVCGTVAQLMQAIHATDVQHSDEERVELIRRLGLGAYYCNPLIAKGRLLGTLSFGTRNRPRFTDEETDLMDAVARYVALADDRLGAARELRHSEERFRQLADAMPQLVWTARGDGTVDYYNLRREEYVGIRQNPDGSWRWEPILHPEDAAPTVEAWEAACRTGTIYQVEHRIQGADGSFRWHLSRATPIRDAEGEIVRWYGTATDIDDLKRVEAERHQSEDRFRAFFENTAVGAMEMTLDSCLTRVNDRFCRITGYGRGELLGSSPHELTHPEDRARQIEGFERLRKGEIPLLEVEKRYLRKDGSFLWVLETTGVIYGRSGEMERLAGLVQDISGRKEAEMARERLIAELDATIGSIPSGVLVYGLDSSVRRMNPAAEGMLRYASEVLSLPLLERKAALRPLNEAGKPYPLQEHPALRALRGETVLSEILAYHPEGRERPLWVSVSAAPIRTEKEIVGAVSTMTDITRLRELQQEREMLIHTISHDLRTPLSVILGHTELLGLVCRGEEADLHVNAILKGTERMEAMISDLVDAARLEGGEIILMKEAVDLGSFLDDMLQRAAAALDVSRIRAGAAPGLPSLDADPNRLERILTNLLTNALKYSPPESPVEIRAVPRGEEVLLSVGDRGKGIAPEDQPRIFDRFYRPKDGRKADSVGLGLYITRSLVEAHGGRIWVESTPGEGSTFHFTLPLRS